MAKPVAIDLFCGLGGWTKGFLAEGYEVIGFDIEHKPSYPGQYIEQDVATISGYHLRSVFRPTVIVASPPCEEFTRWQMPWTRKRNPPVPSLALFDHCKRISEEAVAPLVIENVREAQNWAGVAVAHYGSRYLWGDVPAMLPDAPPSRKEHLSSTARAQRAEIPFDLAQWIARCFKP